MPSRSITPTGPDPTFDSRVEDIVRRLVRAELGQLAGSAAAEARAQEGGRGLGIQNIRRGVGWATITDAGNVTVTAATSGFAALSVPLKTDVVLSGRPIAIVIGASMSAGNTGNLKLSATLRGEEVTGAANGIPGLFHENTTGGLNKTARNGLWVVSAPSPGPATVEVVADAATVDGFLYVTAGSDVASLLVVEL